MQRIAAILENRFGSWCKANELLGLRKIRHFDTTAEDCINDLRLVADKLGITVMAFSDYQPHARFNISLIAKRCGSYKAAIERAGLTPSPLSHETLTDEQLFENLEHLWETLGRQPKRDDYYKPLSRSSYTTYVRRFGSYRKALEVFVASFESPSATELCESLATTAIVSGNSVRTKRHKTSRSISWRMRFLVMRRDSFKCNICGVSPAVSLGTVLVVDHIHAWEAGGETIMENLQTLCEPCNSGKSNLPLVVG